MCRKRIAKDSRANASFAFAAVFILLAVTASSALVANNEKSNEEIASADRDAQSVMRLRQLVTSEMEAAIQGAATSALNCGRQPFDLSLFQSDLERILRQHISDSYPSIVGRFRVNVSALNITTSLSSCGNANFPDAPLPGSIIVSMQAKISASSERVNYETVIDVSQEIATPVPFLSNRLEHIDGSAESGGKMARMVRSILSQLVQLRVLQGFAAPGNRNNPGIGSLLTADDVTFSVNLALQLMEMSDFGTVDPLSWDALIRRAASGERALEPKGDWFSGDIDPFKTYLLLRGGSTRTGVNLRDFAVQALYSLVDQMVLRYLEYSQIIDTANCAVDIRNTLDEGWHSFVELMTGVDSRLDETIHLVGSTFSDLGIPDFAWREIFSSSTDVSLSENSSSVYIFSNRGTLVPVVVGSVPVSIDLPKMSLLNSTAWKELGQVIRTDTMRAGEAVERVIVNLCSEIGARIPDEYVSGLFSSPKSMIQSMLDQICERLASLRETDLQPIGTATDMRPFNERLYAMRDFIDKRWEALFPLCEAMTIGRRLLSEELAETAIVGDPTAMPDNWKQEVASIVLGEMRTGSLVDWDGRLNRSIQLISESLRQLILGMFDAAAADDFGSGQALSGSLMKWIADGVPSSLMISGLRFQTGALQVQILNMSKEFSLDERMFRPSLAGIKLMAGLQTDAGENRTMNLLTRVSQNPAYLEKLELSPSVTTSVDNVDCRGRLVVSISRPDGDPSLSEKSVHYTGLGVYSSFPYETKWMIKARGIVRLAVSDASDSDSLSYRDIGIDLDIPLVALSSWPLDDVDYETSNTMVGDICAALDYVKNYVWKYVSPFAEVFQKAFNQLNDVLSQLSKYINGFAEVVAKACYEIGDWIISKCREILQEVRSSPVWKYLELRLDLFGNFETQFNYGPATVIVGCSVPDLLFRKAKDIVRIVVVTHLQKMTVSVGFRIAKLSDGTYDIVGNSSVRTKDLRIDMRVDPLMGIRDHLFEINGYWKGMHIELWSPDINDYKRFSVQLSDIPFLGAYLSNIPIPELGISVSLNAGLVVKYGLPICDQLAINEVELNPQGKDANREWVELYNPLEKDVSVDGYSLETMHGEIAKIDLSGIVPARGYKAFTFPHASLDNGNLGDSFAMGDSILLRDAGGKALDVTPMISDTSNDGRTWQRSWDGAPKWVFKDSTRAASNGNPLLHTYVDVLTKICVDALELAIDDEKNNVSASLGFVQNLIGSFLKELIGQIAQFAASLIYEAVLFVDIGINDLSGTVGGGFSLKVTVDGEIIRQGILWLAEQLTRLFGRVLWHREVSPNLFAGCHPAEAIYIGFDAYERVGLPKWLNLILTTVNLPTEARVAVSYSMNLATIAKVFGLSWGSYCIRFGVHMDNLPGMDLVNPLMIHRDRVDVWLLRGRIIPAQ